MRRNIHKRLAVLENSIVVPRQAQKSDPASAIQWVKDILQACGVERRPMESLAEAFARCLGVSTRELDNLLLAAADSR
jgi:hypothetical protein